MPRQGHRSLARRTLTRLTREPVNIPNRCGYHRSGSGTHCSDPKKISRMTHRTGRIAHISWPYTRSAATSTDAPHSALGAGLHRHSRSGHGALQDRGAVRTDAPHSACLALPVLFAGPGRYVLHDCSLMCWMPHFLWKPFQTFLPPPRTIKTRSHFTPPQNMQVSSASSFS